MTGEARRWYREPMVWMLIALPLAAVIGGFATLVLAIVSDDGLVVDDYYRQGKEINRVLARDQAAHRHALRGDVRFDQGLGKVDITLAADVATHLPSTLRLRLLHATRAGFDRTLTADRTASGAYQALLPPLPAGHWYVQVEADDWRLVGGLTLPRDTRVQLAGDAAGR